MEKWPAFVTQTQKEQASPRPKRDELQEINKEITFGAGTVTTFHVISVILEPLSGRKGEPYRRVFFVCHFG